MAYRVVPINGWPIKASWLQRRGFRVPPTKMLMELIKETWGRPSALIADRFRLDDLHDAGVPCRVTPRVTRWSESSFDIRALRKRVVDGPFSVAACSRDLLAASLSVAMVKNDDGGSVRLIKKGFTQPGARRLCGGAHLGGGLVRAHRWSATAHYFEDSVLTRLEQRQFYQTPAWKIASRKCRAAAGFLCVRCKAEGFTVAAQVRTTGYRLMLAGLSLEGLEAICRECHEGAHGRAPSKQQQEWKKYLKEKL